MSLKEEFAKISIDNVAKGAAVELFNHGMQEILLNLMDENRSIKKKRKLSLHFEFLPSQDRHSAAVAVTSECKLAAVEGAGSTIYTKMEKGRAVAYVHDVDQPDLGFDNVTPIANR